MNDSPVGYAWIQSTLRAPDFLGPFKAMVAPVKRLQKLADGALLVPRHLGTFESWLEHALFAIKHEGVRLDYLTLALRRVSKDDIQAVFVGNPNGTYIRKLCLLWEWANEDILEDVEDRPIKAGYVPMFDPKHYLVGISRRNRRWRVDFNGLGDLQFCPVVRKTEAIDAGLAADVLAQAQVFAAEIGPKMLDRALSWAYMSETEGSFAIEGEAPSQDKATRFANLLKCAHAPKPLTEEYLTALQNMTISNPFDQAVSFRIEQNRLQASARGAAGVTYVPPRPDLCADLMGHLMTLCNERPPNLDPLAHAGLISFAFVFLHPFMDGNGRLSRYLIHHCLGQSGCLPAGFLLPISVAMKKHEELYWQSLTDFSRPARDLCEVTWFGDDNYEYRWMPDNDVWFRYMDLTQGVSLVLSLAKISLETYLREEVMFLELFDDVSAFINARHDLRSTDLANLIVTIHQNGGVLSSNRRKRFKYRVQEHVLDDIERAVSRRLQGLTLATTGD